MHTKTRRGLLASALLGLIVCGAVATGSSSSLAGPVRGHLGAPTRLQKVTPGVWTELAPSLGATFTGTPAVWTAPDDDAMVLWERHIDGTKYTYEEVTVSPTGAVVGAPMSIFGATGWVGLTNDPTLVSHGAVPLLIFNGGRDYGNDPYAKGCVVGAVEAHPAWTLEGWSLSHDCYNPNAHGTETASGELSAAWPGAIGGHSAVLYRLGTSGTIPATGMDDGVTTAGKGDVGQTAEASDTAGSDDVWVAWDQFFSSPAGDDGYYVRNATSNGPVRKAPGSDTNSVDNLFSAADLAMTNTNTHAGIYLAYCASVPTCSLLLWHVGSSTARKIPSSSPASDVAISAGPDGRVWIAWYNHTTNDVSTVRTNKADTAFGPVETYKTPCFEDGLLGISGGPFGRLDVALQCINNAHLRSQDYVTQSLPGLSLHLSQGVIKNSVDHTVTFTVTDAGDPVGGATVTVDGKSGHTGTSGTVSITFPKGSKAGSFAVKASATDYFPASGHLHIES